MNLDEWAIYSRSLTRNNLHPPDTKLFNEVALGANGRDIWNLRSLSRLSIFVLDERPHRDHWVKVASAVLAKRGALEVIDISEDLGQVPDGRQLATRPTATLSLVIHTNDAPDGKVFMSYSLTLSRKACLVSEGDLADRAFVDRAPVDANLWSKSGFEVGGEVEARRKLEAEVTDHLTQLAGWIGRANPR
jgi:hypothetical protein